MTRQRAVAPREERAGIYVRVSLDRAAHGLQEEILSPETQEDRCRQYCGAQLWSVAVVEQDLDESGYRRHYSHRQGLMRLLEAVERGELTKLLVFKFSRLSRRLKEFLEICDRVESAGAGIVSITEQVDTSTPAGRLIRNILASFAQFQSEEISEQIFETWMTKAKRGERPPGFAPFGTVNRKGLLEPHPETHPHLLAIYRVYRETGSVRTVWDYLTSQGVPAPKAGEWNLNTLRGILTNPIYIGRLEWAGQLFQAKWAPLVPEELWEAVQQLIANRRSLPTPRRDAHLLTGLIRCNRCGRPMWTKYAKRSRNGVSRHRRVYWCCSPQTQRRGCKTPVVDGEEVEQAVWEAVSGVIQAAGIGAVTAPPADRPGRRRQQLLAEEERLRRHATQLFDLLSEGSITLEQFREQNLRTLERLKSIRRSCAEKPVEPGGARTAQEALLATTPDERRMILAAVGARVEVGGQVVLDLLGLRVRLQGRRVGETWHFGDLYNRLDFQGSTLTDKQQRFVARAYRWADRAELARRIGRSCRALVQLAKRLRLCRQEGQEASR